MEKADRRAQGETLHGHNPPSAQASPAGPHDAARAETLQRTNACLHGAPQPL
jgi:hypothetical protein